MAEAKDAGKAIGAAILDLRGRMAVAEAKESIVIPVPSVEVSADISALVDAIQEAGVAGALKEIAAAIPEPEPIDFGPVVAALEAVQAELEANRNSLSSLGEVVSSAVLTPKELFFDEAGDPVGIKPITS